MSNLKYFDEEQLLREVLNCIDTIDRLNLEREKEEKKHPAFISFVNIDKIKSQISGQYERLKWVNHYLEKFSHD